MSIFIFFSMLTKNRLPSFDSRSRQQRTHDNKESLTKSFKGHLFHHSNSKDKERACPIAIPEGSIRRWMRKERQNLQQPATDSRSIMSKEQFHGQATDWPVIPWQSPGLQLSGKIPLSPLAGLLCESRSLSWLFVKSSKRTWMD